MARKISVFTICKQILDWFGVSDEQLEGEIHSERSYLSKAYSSKAERKAPVKYDDEILQFGYIQKYMAFRVSAIEFLVGAEIPPKRRRVNLFSYCNEIAEDTAVEIRVLSIGCGPASEMVGIVKYCIENNVRSNIHFDLFDKYDWATTICKVARVLEGLKVEEQKPNFTYQFVKELDFNSDIGTNENLLACANEANLIIFCWSMSDFRVRNHDKGVMEKNIELLFKSARYGTYFIIVESSRPHVKDWLDYVDPSQTIRNETEAIDFKIGVIAGQVENELGRYFDNLDRPQLGKVIQPLIFVK